MNAHTNNTTHGNSQLQTVPFHGDEIVTFDYEGTHYVAMRRIVENMGLSWGGQHGKLIDQAAKFSCLDIRTTGADGKTYTMFSMPVEKLPLWLSSINPNKVKFESVRVKVERYQAESAIALHDYWTKGVAIRQKEATVTAVNPAHVAREARLFFKMACSIAKTVGLAGNQALIAANRGTRAATGFDILEAMGSPVMLSPVNDRLVNATTVGSELGISAVKVNHLLHEMGAQEGVTEHDRRGKERKSWRPTRYGTKLGGQMVDVDRDNGTGAAQQLKWPVSIVDVIRTHIDRGAA